MDLSKLGKKFGDFNLNIDNILDFMSTEQNDQTKYVLKLYLLSVLEDYKHIDILLRYIFFDEKFEDNPQLEIINKKDQKKFWKKVMELKQQKISKSKMNFLRIINNHNLLNSFSELVCNFEQYEKELKQLNDKLNMEQNFLEKIKLKKQIKLLVEGRKKKKQKIIQKLHTTKEDFDEFFQISLKYYRSFDWKEISYIEDPSDISWYYFNKKIYSLCEKINGLHHTIDCLENDLISSYQMICVCFDKDILEEENLLNIVSKIRINMREKYFNYQLRDQYRSHNLQTDAIYNINGKGVKESKFWKETADHNEIGKLMDELSKKYEKIKSIENNDEYIYACYEITQEFLQIHPYPDGNGRTSKFLFYILLLKRNILPFTITDSNYLTNCYEQKGKTEEYVHVRQIIMNNRVGDQGLLFEEETIKHKK